MWFFMNTCYLLTLITFILLVTTGLQGWLHFPILNANHPTFALLTMIVYLFTETLVIFFFVGTGASIKEYTKEHHLKPDYQRQSLAIKRKIYPPLLLNMLLVMILFISGGAVDTNRLPSWLHGTLYGICLLHFVAVIRIQHHSFKENTALVLRMSGVNS